MGTTEKLISYIVSTDFSALPEAAVQTAKMAILDCLGCILSGSAEPASRLLTEAVKDWGGHPQAAVIGAGFRTAAPWAALANGTAGHAQDYDDGHITFQGHPSVTLVPAALAVAELQNSSGADLITAYILGLELGGRMGTGITGTHYERGWHATSTLGTLGAAVAAARILKLDQDSTQQAVGLAASLASGLRGNFGTMTKPFHAGSAARNGVTAAMLVQRGFTADPNIIEGLMGFCQVVCGEGEYDLDKMVQEMGHTYQILDPGMGFKRYPCCASTFQALDATLRLVEKHDLAPENVESVDCAVSYIVPKVLIHHRPTIPMEAMFSMEYCVAVALLDRQVGLAQFLSERITEEKVQELLTRVQMRVHPELRDRKHREDGRQFAVVTIRLGDGQVLSQRIDARMGSPRDPNPMSQAELLSKYRELAQRALPAEQVEKSIDLLEQLETLGNVKELVAVILPESVG